MVWFKKKVADDGLNCPSMEDDEFGGAKCRRRPDDVAE